MLNVSRLPLSVLWLLLWSGCAGPASRPVLHAPPTLCLGWPCQVPLRALSAPTSGKDTVLSDFAHRRRLAPLDTADRVRIRWRALVATVTQGPKTQPLHLQRGGHLIIRSLWQPQRRSGTHRSCALGASLDVTRATVTEPGRAPVAIPVYYPRSPVLILDRLPKSGWRRFAALLRCLGPVALRQPVLGEIEALRAFGVRAFALGGGARGPVFKEWAHGGRAKALIIDLDRGAVKTLWFADTVELLQALYRAGELRRGQVFRVFEELRREGVKPGRFLPLSGDMGL